MRGLHYTACVIAVGAATAALAHGSATGIVKERMDGMIVLRDSMKAMGPMMQGKTEYDGAVVRARASAIRQHSGEALSSLFPQGSGGMPSEATDAVWEDWERFTMISNRLETLAVALEAGAGNGLMKDGMGGMMNSGTMQEMMAGGMSMPMDEGQLAAMPADALFTMIGNTCSACHEKFRAKMQ
ncbi:c-type cytochrome [Hoeflea alexandrii]|jgi:cytochrome c556